MDYTPVSGVSGNDGPSGDEVLAEVAQQLLDAQVSASDVIDSRISTAFGIGSSVLPVTIGLLNLLPAGLSTATQVLLAGALGAYAVQIGCASLMFLSRRRELAYRPNVETLRGYSAIHGGAELRRWVTDERIYAITFNEAVLRWKGRLAFGVIASLYVEAAFLSVSAFLSLI